MNYYYGRRRRYNISRYPYRFNRGTYTTSSRSTRRAIGNYRAAQQQKDSTQINLSIPSRITCFSGETAYVNEQGVASSLTNGVAAINIFDILRKSEFYQSYANMYDQMKIDSIRVKLTPYSFPIIGNDSEFGNMYRSYTVVTAWDRSGLSDAQTLLVNKLPALGEDVNDLIGELNQAGESVDSNGLYINLTGDNIATYSSAITKNVNPNTNTSIVRRLYPSSLQEKAQYVNTSDIDEWYTKYDSDKGRYIGIPNYTGVYGARKITVEDTEGIDQAGVPLNPMTRTYSLDLYKNPSYIEESSNVPFKPTLLVGLKNDPVTSGGDTVKPSMTFSAEFDIGVTFRGLRKANVV